MTGLEIPAAPAPDRRPFRLRAVEGPVPSRWRCSRPGVRATSGRATARRRSATSSRGSAPAWPSSSRCRTATRSALGNGGTTAFWDVATFCLVETRSQHLSFGEFSSKFAECTRAAPFLEDPQVIASEPGTHPDPVADAAVDAYCLTHNETSTGVQTPVRRPRARRRRRRATGSSSSTGPRPPAGLRVDPAEIDAYYFAPQKCFGSDGGLWLALLSPAAIERVEQARGLRPLRARLLGPQDRHRELPPRPDLQHAGARDAAAARRAGRLVPRQRRPRVGRLACGPLGRDRLRLGRALRATPRPSSPSPPSAAMSPRRSTSTTASTRSRWRRCSARTASSTPSRTASWGATSCASRCFPGSTPETSRP